MIVQSSLGRAPGLRVSFRKRLATVALVSALIAGGNALIFAPAATAAHTDCSDGYACMWTKNSYEGDRSDFKIKLVLTGSSNKINSVANKGNSQRARFYDRADYTGANILMNNPARGGQSRDPNLSNGTDATTANWANRISSGQFVSG